MDALRSLIAGIVRASVPVTLAGIAFGASACSDGEGPSEPDLLTIGLEPDGALAPCVDREDGAEGSILFTNASDSKMRVSILDFSVDFSPREIVIAPRESGRLAWKLTRDASSFELEAVWDSGWFLRGKLPVRPIVHEKLFRVEAERVEAFGRSPGRVTITNTSAIAGRVSVGAAGPFIAPQADVLVPGRGSAPVGFELTVAAAKGTLGDPIEGALRVRGAICGTGSSAPIADVPVIGRRSLVAKQIAAGAAHTCAVTDVGAVHCWGDNELATLGSSFGRTVVVSERPVPVAHLTESVTSIAAGSYHTLALREGRVFCWGRGSEGQCGEPANDVVDTVREVALPANAVSVHAGSARSCAVLADGRVFCWGAAIATPRWPTEVAGVSNPRVLAIGTQHLCALSKDGAVSCTGQAGLVGDGTTNPSDSFVPVSTAGVMGPVEDLVAGDRFTCARGRFVACWGDVPGVAGSVVQRLAPNVETPAMAMSARTTTWCSGEGDVPVSCRSSEAFDTSALGNFTPGDAIANGFVHACTLRGGRVYCAGKVASLLGGSAAGRAVTGFDVAD